ncbi:response regulator [Rossellomorea marisflavi]|uniref:response regulator n=1 Tax=Rossellomorea marisflavi TaxID=189381 RepID=UPI001EE2908E|nr:response regulator [Rossellomorea marisflavi]UKS65084.1 response regulator [Rossellomorea marisflavi]
MYSVLIADDELNILEGIAALVRWGECGTELTYKAHNGVMAYEWIRENPVDIVITDIKMPGMNGVELIQKVHAIHPHIRFIVLSGYDEFEYAKGVMEYNVKHYLLKPSNEEKIEEALQQIVEGLDEEKQKQEVYQEIQQSLHRVLPIAKEQFLKDYLTGKTYWPEDWEHYGKLFDLREETYRILVFHLDDDHDIDERFVLKEALTNELLKHHHIILSTITGERILLLIEGEAAGERELIEHIKEFRKEYSTYYRKTFTTALSEPSTPEGLKEAYGETISCLSQSFYLGNNSILTTRDVRDEAVSNDTLLFDHDEFLYMLKSGNVEEAECHLRHFFIEIDEKRYPVNVLKSHCIELFMLMIRQSQRMDDLLKDVMIVSNLDSFEELRSFIENAARDIAGERFQRNKVSQSSIIQRMMDYVDEHLSDPDLSLSQVANDVLYMNSDYIGKLFKKEKGEKFSNYLLDKRIQKAVDLMERSGEIKVFEVAEAVGFGNNPRYFGQVFKKYVGVTPKEYLNREQV